MAEFVSSFSSIPEKKIISPHIILQPIPYHHEIPDFRLPAKIQLSGVVKENANRFEVDLKSTDGEFLLHFNPRFNVNFILLINIFDNFRKIASCVTVPTMGSNGRQKSAMGECRLPGASRSALN